MLYSPPDQALYMKSLQVHCGRPMTCICFQAKEGRLDNYTMSDAEVTERAGKL